MASTNKTNTLKLPQFIGSDKPSWIGDINPAFKAIDDKVGEMVGELSSVQTVANAASAKADSASAEASVAKGVADDASRELNTLDGLVDSLTSDVENLGSRVQRLEQESTKNNGMNVYQCQQVGGNKYLTTMIPSGTFKSPQGTYFFRADGIFTGTRVGGVDGNQNDMRLFLLASFTGQFFDGVLTGTTGKNMDEIKLTGQTPRRTYYGLAPCYSANNPVGKSPQYNVCVALTYCANTGKTYLFAFAPSDTIGYVDMTHGFYFMRDDTIEKYTMILTQDLT